MALKIVHYPHPSLRHKAKPLTAIDAKVVKHAEEMLALMYDSKGLGLAATQVALPYQLLVMNPTSDVTQREREAVYVNPVILERKGTVEGEEGCLSFPGLFKKVRRAKSVKVVAYNLKGQRVEISPADVLESRVLQHEIDHLHGELFIDKIGSLAKWAIRGTLESFERDYRRSQERGEIPPNEKIEEELTALAALA